MQCPNCGHTDKITIKDTVYCSNCGLPYPDNGAAVPSSPTPPANPVSVPVNGPPPTHPTLSQDPVMTPNRPAVVDLRPTSIDIPPNSPPPVTAIPPAPALPPLPVPPPPAPPSVPTPPPPPPPVKVPSPPPTPIPPSPDPASADSVPSRLQQRIAAASTTPRSTTITKFSGTRLTDLAPPAAAPATPLASTPAPHLPPAVTVAVNAAQAAASPAPPGPTVPSAVTGPNQAFDLAMAGDSPPPPTPALKPLAVVSALIVLTGMGGYIWLQNSPKLALKNAANRAGFAATLPSYLPSSYNQTGPVQSASGQVTMSYNSPGSTSPLTITQQSTEWDSQSLLNDYVSKQTDNYLAVTGQGLTIYLFKGQVTWVNHGVWFIIRGSDRLGQEQILKIVYSL